MFYYLFLGILKLNFNLNLKSLHFCVSLFNQILFNKLLKIFSVGRPFFMLIISSLLLCHQLILFKIFLICRNYSCFQSDLKTINFFKVAHSQTWEEGVFHYHTSLPVCKIQYVSICSTVLMKFKPSITFLIFVYLNCLPLKVIR